MRRALPAAALLLACGCGVFAVKVPGLGGLGPAAEDSVSGFPEASPPAQEPAALKSPDPEKKEQAAILSALQYVETRLNSYEISPADLLSVSVYQEEDMDKRVRVSPEGLITLPLIGRVRVGGLSVPGAEEAIRDKLARFVKDPQVSVFIDEYGNKQVYVLGEVKKPGSYPLPTEAPLSVIEAITLAGGFTEYASLDRTRVIRKAEGRSQAFVVEVSAITKRGDKSKDLQLLPNDVVFVPESLF